MEYLHCSRVPASSWSCVRDITLNPVFLVIGSTLITVCHPPSLICFLLSLCCRHHHRLKEVHSRSEPLNFAKKCQFLRVEVFFHAGFCYALHQTKSFLMSVGNDRDSNVMFGRPSDAFVCHGHTRSCCWPTGSQQFVKVSGGNRMSLPIDVELIVSSGLLHMSMTKSLTETYLNAAWDRYLAPPF